MRKFTAILTASLLLLSLVSCGKDKEDGNSAVESSSSSSTSGELSTPARPNDDSSAKTTSTSRSHSSPNTTATSLATSSSDSTASSDEGASSGSTTSADDQASENETSRFRTIFFSDTNSDNVAQVVFDTEYWKMPYGREDDGQFTRDGYVLLGYSYDPNGKGELIRPGYKYTFKTAAKEQVLYCVWAKETSPASFKTTQKNNTVYITGYTGSDKVVYIPQKINGKTVTGIAANAFSNNKTITEVHITSSVRVVEAKAFSSCTNLKTVTLYDNLQTISDTSFSGTPVKTVRLCAGQTPRYTNSAQTFGIKYERLVNTVGEKRIIVVAGSSALYGIDSDYMETMFKDKYTVVNFGTNGNMNVPFFLDAILPYLTKNDIVVFSPEQYGPHAYHTNGNPELPSVTLSGVSTCYNLFENIDVSTYTAVFDGIRQYCAQSARMVPLSWDDHSESIDEIGDRIFPNRRLNSTSFRYGANGQFRFDETVIPAEYIPNLNRIIDNTKATGAKILFSYPPHNKNNINKDSLNEKAYDSYNKWIAQTVHCPLISDVRNYIYPGQYFDNTDYHLNAVGRELHTKQLAQDIIAANVGVK